MATSKTPRRKAATEAAAEPAEQASAKKKPAAKAALGAPAAKPAAAGRKTAAKPAAKAAKASVKPTEAEAAPAAKPAKAVVATKAAAKPAAKPTAQPTAKPAAKPTAKPATKAADQPAVKSAARKAASAAEPVAAVPVKKASRKKAAEQERTVPVPTPEAEKPAKPARARKTAQSEPVVAAEAAKPARKTRKSATPAVAAPVAALVAEVAAVLEQPAVELPAPSRKRAGSRAKPAAEQAVVEAPVLDTPSEPVEPAAAKPARKTRGARKAAVEVVEAGQEAEGETVEVDDADAEQAAAPAPQGPDWRWHKAQPGLFGLYTIQAADGASLAELDLQGSGVGHYRCSCAEFADSEEGRCAHAPWLVDQLVAGRDEQARRLAAGPETPWSELGLSAGWERRLVWRLGQGASPALRALAQECADEQGRFLAPLEGQVLPTLLQAAAEEGHELRVGAEVWQQLALSADAGDRVERLAQHFEQGLASPSLHALVNTALPEVQWEAALFAVCAGRALLADESPLPQRPSAVAAARLWQRCFDVGAVAIVAPESLQAAWREEVQGLLGAWPETWILLAPDALQQAAGSELLIVDAVETLAEFLPALRQLAAPHLLLISQRELLGTELLAPLVAWIDEARRGPYAALRRLGADAGKRQQREVLETVMLARRRRDLVAALPASMLAQVQTHWLRVPAEATPGLALDTADLQLLQRLQQRWARVGGLSAGEQLQLQQALLRLRLGQGAMAECIGEARASALVALLPTLVPGHAERVVVFAQQDAALRPLALALQDLGLPLANLRQHQSAEVRALELQAWAEGEASVLLATDAACAGLDLRQAGAAALVHADLCWNPALMRQRLERLGVEGAGVPAWALVLEAGFDPAVLAAQAQEEALPSGLQDGEAGAIPFLAGADLAGFMAALERALAARAPA